MPKADRYMLWQRIEWATLTVIEQLLLAGQRGKEAKHAPLEQASVQLNLLRILIRLTKDTKIIDLKKYALIQQDIDEIGRMLGGWLKSTKSATPPPRGIFEKMKERHRKCQRDGTPLFQFVSSFQLLTLRPLGWNLTFTRLP